VAFRSGGVIPCQRRDHAARMVGGRFARALERVDRLDQLQKGGTWQRRRKYEALRQFIFRFDPRDL